jgi:asparagine synthase (glutamine-hydrolysing)
MCGIFGGYNISSKICEASINLIDRGNDGISIDQIEKDIFFAARRHLIKISGLEDKFNQKSDQPYYSEDNNIAIVFNGEFYNFEEYKKDLVKTGIKFKTSGDTEVFLKLYELKGISFLEDKNIDAFFSIAIYDKRINKLFIARDWPGRVPLFYLYNENRFIFSSELKGFRGVPNISLQQPIELEPGHYVEFDLKSKNISKFKYFTPLPTILEQKNKDIFKIGQKLHLLLDSSSRNRTMGDVPICTMLSGGIDSLLTTFYVFKNINFSDKNYLPTSYVFQVEGFDSLDVERAKIAAKGFSEIGLKLKIITATKGQIIEDAPKIINSFEMRELKALSFYPLPIYWYLGPEMKKDGFKVTIGGHGVDELLGAYDSWKELDKPHSVQVRLASRLAFINKIYFNMMKRASVIFMNRGPIEARFPFLRPEVCEYMLAIDKKWLELNPYNAEIAIDLIEKSKSKNIESIKKLLINYLNDQKNFFEKKNGNEDRYELQKIFWKFPLIVSSFFASQESFLKFDLVFRPKLRGQHGAGITSIEKDLVKNYHAYGNNDIDVFKNMSLEIFK